MMMKKRKQLLTREEQKLLEQDILKAIRKESCDTVTQCFIDRQYIACVTDILQHPKFQQMSQYTQHGTTTTLEHCMSVSYLSYKIARSYHLDYRSAARGALLHDLFLYDWHSVVKDTGNHLHGLTHPKTALLNADKYFSLNDKEKDIILKHMWPITIVPPKYAEGYIVSYIDKYCGFAETWKCMKIKAMRKNGGMLYGYDDGNYASGHTEG